MSSFGFVACLPVYLYRVPTAVSRVKSLMNAAACSDRCLCGLWSVQACAFRTSTLRRLLVWWPAVQCMFILATPRNAGLPMPDAFLRHLMHWANSTKAPPHSDARSESQSTAHRLQSDDLCLFNAVVYLWTASLICSTDTVFLMTTFYDAVVDLLCLTKRLIPFPARMNSHRIILNIRVPHVLTSTVAIVNKS